MHHFRRTKKRYVSLNKKSSTKGTCSFCTSAKNEQIIAENDTMYVVKNRVSYDLFEGYRVSDHLLILPKAHRASIAEFTPEEARDFVALSGEYEVKGYSVYARGFDSPARSVAHQHTHLIKIGGTPSRFMLYSSRPHVLIAK